MKNNIVSGHNFKEYHEKYGKKFDKGKLKFIAFRNKKQLEQKKKYWKILKKEPSTEFKQGFYEISNKKFLVPLFISFGVVAITTAVVVPIYVLKDNPYIPPQPTEDEIAINQINEIIKGTDYYTCYDAVMDIRLKTGIYLEEISPKDTSKEFVFDLYRDIVCLLDKETILLSIHQRLLIKATSGNLEMNTMQRLILIQRLKFILPT